jgi:hypothetical protein
MELTAAASSKQITVNDGTKRIYICQKLFLMLIFLKLLTAVTVQLHPVKDGNISVWSG